MSRALGTSDQVLRLCQPSDVDRLKVNGQHLCPSEIEIILSEPPAELQAATQESRIQRILVALSQ